MPEKIRNVTAVPTAGIVTKVGKNVPRILPTVLKAPRLPTTLPPSSRLSTVYFTREGVTVPSRNSGNTNTIMQERKKVNILVFDNCGFGCINNLEMNHGIGSIATEFRYTDGKKPCGDLIPVDYAKIGEGYGLKTYTCKTIAELEAALEDAKKQEIACLFDLKVIPKTMTDGYESWWNVGIATTSSKESVRKACVGVLEGRREARDY